MTTIDVPEDSATRAAVAGELAVIDWLAGTAGLTVAGLRWAHWRITQEPTVYACTGPLADLREYVAVRLAHTLAAATGMPASYWLDRAQITVPDTLDDNDQNEPVAELEVMTDDDGQQIPGTARILDDDQ